MPLAPPVTIAVRPDSRDMALFLPLQSTSPRRVPQLRGPHALRSIAALSNTSASAGTSALRCVSKHEAAAVGAAPIPRLRGGGLFETAHRRQTCLRCASSGRGRDRGRALPLRRHPGDEGRERGELLLDEAARGLVRELLLVELRGAIADEDLRLVEGEGVEKDR